MIDPDLGYDPDDQFYYSRQLVAELIPMALAGPQPPARGLSDTPGTGGDPAEGGNMLAMILDVRRALDQATGWRSAAIGCTKAGQDVPDHILDQIVDYLGGPRAARH